jgi:hypothetical protein
MNIIRIPSPGTPEGPCRGSCNHPRCCAIRELALVRCAYCRQCVGFGARIVEDPPAHVTCFNAAAAREHAPHH